MKKIIALLLAVIMVMGLATVVSAEGEGQTPATSDGVTASDAGTITFTKTYYKTNEVDNAKVKPAEFPAETLSFTISGIEGYTNPDSTMITIDDTLVAANPQSIVINVPSYNKVGVYKYHVVEDAGTTQGVGYTAAAFDVTVTAYFNDTHDKILTDYKIVTKGDDGEKISNVNNTYDMGNMSVTKAISGNLASNTTYFDMTVTFKATGDVKSAITVKGGSGDHAVEATIPASAWTNKTATYDIALKAGDTITFSNIPQGVTYSIDEADKYEVADANLTDPEKGYTVTGEVTDKAIAIDTTTPETITNTKNTDVATGIAMDSVPFVVMIVIAVLGLVAFTAKKRVQE